MGGGGEGYEEVGRRRRRWGHTCHSRCVLMELQITAHKEIKSE